MNAARLIARHFPVALTDVPARFKRRVIYDREGGSPYLARFYLTRPPTMPDGSEPFGVSGNPRPGIEWRSERGGISIFVHYFYRSDDDEALHNHPWKWALSLVLAGGYSEERRVGNGVVRRLVKPGSLNLLKAETFHRVDLLTPERGCWSLFIAGPKSSGWGFWDRRTGEFLPWREFIAKIRGVAPEAFG
jgi:hypothetical protein